MALVLSSDMNFCSLAETLMLCANHLFTHLPASYIQLEVESDTFKLVDQLKKLEIARKHVNHFNDLILKRIELQAYCTKLYLLFLESKGKKDKWDDLCLSNACLIFCTASNSIKVNTNVEMVIIDEAAQLKEADSVIPLSISGVRSAVLIGDDRQLPAMVQSKVSSNANFGRSLFQRLSTLGKKKHLLNIQYRMHPSISLFPNKEFYKNKIIDAPHVKEISYKRSFLDGAMYGSYSFINVQNGKESFTQGNSPTNLQEATVIGYIIAKLFNGHCNTEEKLSVGIISPYKGQVSLIQQKIGKKYENYKGKFAVNVRTVDGFQGGEEDIIIISTVRCNGTGSVGFLSNHQRTNVALTRARYCLWIVGNEATLAESRSIWEDLVIDAKTRGCFFNAYSDTHLVRPPVKPELTVSLQLGNTIWKVIYTDDFKISVASIDSKKTQQQVQDMLKRIANGRHHQPNSDDEDMASVAIDGIAAELLRIFKVVDDDEQLLFYLTWSIDAQKEESNFTQVIKVWDILLASKIPQLANKLNILFDDYTPDFINRCKHNSFQGNLAVPMSWSIQSVVSTERLTNQFSAMSITNDQEDQLISTFIRYTIGKLWRWVSGIGSR